MSGKDKPMTVEQPHANWRTTVGIAILVASIGWPVLIPILPLVGVSTTATAAFSGVMVVAADLMLIAGAAIAGKAGFASIKAKVFGLLRLCGPPREVSRRRYTIGLVIFSIPLAFGWASPYFGHHIPGFASGQLICAVALDILLLISLFVLGGDFWDKLRALFDHNAYAVIPSTSAAERTPD